MDPMNVGIYFLHLVNKFCISCAVWVAEAGFCPVTSVPSTTTWFSQLHLLFVHFPPLITNWSYSRMCICFLWPISSFPALLKPVTSNGWGIFHWIVSGLKFPLILDERPWHSRRLRKLHVQFVNRKCPKYTTGKAGMRARCPKCATTRQIELTIWGTTDRLTRASPALTPHLLQLCSPWPHRNHPHPLPLLVSFRNGVYLFSQPLKVR